MASAQYIPDDLPKAMMDSLTPSADWVIVMPIAVLMMTASIILMLRNKTTGHALLAGLGTLLTILFELILLKRVIADGPLTMTMGQWLPPFGISFTVDTLGALLSITSAFATLICIIYSVTDSSNHERRFGFYPLLIMMLTGVTGSFMTGDLFNLYVWFEVMLISSFGLIVMGGSRLQLDGAVKYGFLNFLATTLFLVATAYLYGVTGTLNMAHISIKIVTMPLDGVILAIACLFVLAFGMKAAAFPVNFWLPASYHTPKPVISAIFAGLLTKVGAYALIRTLLLIMPTTHNILSDAVGYFAAATMVIAALCALPETNLRRILGFFVISGIGSILVGLAINNEAALTGMTVYAVHSILVMTALYLLCGVIERITGTNNTRLMGSLYVTDPLVTILFFILFLAIAGLPPLSGFWAKLLLVNATLHSGDYGLTAALLINGLLLAIVGGRIWTHIFLRGGVLGSTDGILSSDLNLIKMNGMDRALTIMPIVLIIVAIGYIGLWPQTLIETALNAAQGLSHPENYVKSVFLGNP